MTLPAYRQILQTFRTRIAQAEWRIGDEIPTDEELVQQFGVSRHTVRAALDVLVADGVIKRYRRRGSFLAARPPGAGTWLLTSLDDLVLSGFPTPPIVLDTAETGPAEEICPNFRTLSEPAAGASRNPAGFRSAGKFVVQNAGHLSAKPSRIA